jgi:LuxR family maltose regulon positive regulatory protein
MCWVGARKVTDERLNAGGRGLRDAAQVTDRAMAHTTPQVDSQGYVGEAGAASPLLVGTPTWYSWLETVTSFAFVSAHGRFTARKERPWRAGGYWKAYRKQAGHLQTAYLGKSADLTLDRLTHVARQLAENQVPAAASTPDSAAAASALELLSTKLHIPALRPNLVARPHLIERLEAGLAGPLTLIAAPAGRT